MFRHVFVCVCDLTSLFSSSTPFPPFPRLGYGSPQVFKGGKDCVLFLIDCSPPMFDEFAGASEDGEEGATFFSTAVKAVHSALRNKIVCSDKDLVGIVFFSTVRDHKGRFKN